ncbi:hypothetical protein JTB14_006401 [Gonioctena quinquepunctata]|nr:hypothetical protein JTB14_006401 [Gonioctena quinquepunctata]
MDYLSMDGCNIEKCLPRVFSSLEKFRALDIRNSKIPIEEHIFEDSKNINSLSLSDLEFSSSTKLKHLMNLETLSFSDCKFEQLNKEMFSELGNLKYLSISDCDIASMSADCFNKLSNLEGLNIRDSKIGDVNCESMLKLANLKRLSFHHIVTASELDYKIFSQLPSLETVHFETSIYRTLNFDDFNNLKTVEIGYVDQQSSPEEDELVEKLKANNITSEGGGVPKRKPPRPGKDASHSRGRGFRNGSPPQPGKDATQDSPPTGLSGTGGQYEIGSPDSHKQRGRRTRLPNGGLFYLLLRAPETSASQHPPRKDFHGSSMLKAQVTRYKHISQPRTVVLPRQDKRYWSSRRLDILLHFRSKPQGMHSCKKDVDATPLPQGPGSFPYETENPPQEVASLIGHCEEPLLLGCDANSHHQTATRTQEVGPSSNF